MQKPTLVMSMILSASLAFTGSALAADVAVKITPDLAGVDVMHNGKKVTIMRDQNQKATVNPDFAKTSRKCPPFCINPMQLAPGVETVGEVEVLAYLDKMTKGDKSILVVDSRTPDWVAKGTIPGSVNIPWTKLAPQKGARCSVMVCGVVSHRITFAPCCASVIQLRRSNGIVVVCRTGPTWDSPRLNKYHND
jgi:rhodanese-related sulfurtransferase